VSVLTDSEMCTCVRNFNAIALQAVLLNAYAIHYCCCCLCSCLEPFYNDSCMSMVPQQTAVPDSNATLTEHSHVDTSPRDQL
jgi:hypothetical protein